MGRKKWKKAGSKSPKQEQPERDKLRLWQGRLLESDTYWKDEQTRMDEREALYKGSNEIRPLVPKDTNKDGSPLKASHVHNIIFENIESQVSSAIPQPKVTPRRPQDEYLASKIEHWLRNELDRLDFETMNDMAERTVPIQGGVGFMVEWDNQRRSHDTIGECAVSAVHPKKFAPQPGIYTGVEDMDWFIVKIPTTKEAVRRRYGVSVYDETEAEPSLRSSGQAHLAQDAVTMYVGYEKGESGIDKYVWVNDIELEDLENYQARRQPVCAKCGRVRPLPGQVIYNTVRGGAASDTQEAVTPEQLERVLAEQLVAREIAQKLQTGEAESAMEAMPLQAEPAQEASYDGGPCPWCGCKEFRDAEMEFEQVIMPFRTAGGVDVPGAEAGFDSQGNPVIKPTLIPFYKPDIYPIVLQKSVSVYGQLLGNSDVDIMADQQNTLNRMNQKIIDRMIKAGTKIAAKGHLDINPRDGDVVQIENIAELQAIKLLDFTGNLQYEMAFEGQVYEQARQMLGITDSFQGRRDPTATSGRAKEYSAAQAAGRMESKRIMKNAAYAKLFEMMFKMWLAYSDEPRPVSYKDFKGQTMYESISRYDFLERDADGQFWWNDMFLFSCDTSAPLASNREAMWQDLMANFKAGAFGDPGETATQILVWGMMEMLHYPNAGAIKQFLEDKQKREAAQAQQAMAQQAAAQQEMQMTAPGGGQL